MPVALETFEHPGLHLAVPENPVHAYHLPLYHTISGMIFWKKTYGAPQLCAQETEQPLRMADGRYLYTDYSVGVGLHALFEMRNPNYIVGNAQNPDGPYFTVDVGPNARIWQMTDEDGDHRLFYMLTDLPMNKQITISAYLSHHYQWLPALPCDEPELVGRTYRYFKPFHGQIELTPEQPWGHLDFEMELG